MQIKLKPQSKYIPISIVSQTEYVDVSDDEEDQ